MRKLKRISIIALLVYIAMVPLGMIVPREPEIGRSSSKGTEEGITAAGEVVFKRGFITGIAHYSISTGKMAYSTDDALSAIKSGEVEHSKIAWQVDWLGLPMGYLGVWLIVGFTYWFVTQEEPHCREESTNNEDDGSENAEM